MTAVAAYRTPESLKAPFSYSVLLHAAIAGLLIYSTIAGHRGENWGGPGGSITVGLAGSVPAIPLPIPDVVSPSRVVDNSRGLYETEPPPEIPIPPPDAVPIPKFNLKPPPSKAKTIAPAAPPPPKSHPSKILENKTPPPPNAIPYGHGGAPMVPTSSFALGSGATQGGMAMNGAGGGDFGSRFSWYVEAVQRRVSSNWLQSTIDPRLATAPRVVVTFDILRDGTITNTQVTQSSNNYSVDSSAVRAVQSSSPLQPLPPAYSGSRVTCEFWFDFRRQ